MHILFLTLPGLLYRGCFSQATVMPAANMQMLMLPYHAALPNAGLAHAWYHLQKHHHDNKHITLGLLLFPLRRIIILDVFVCFLATCVLFLRCSNASVLRLGCEPEHSLDAHLILRHGMRSCSVGSRPVLDAQRTDGWP